VTSAASATVVRREPDLNGQTVVIIGGSAGIGLETARRARAEGAEIILAARHQDQLEKAADDVGASGSVAFDATDQDLLEMFFAGLPVPVDHVMVTGPGPYYAPLAELDRDRAHRAYDAHQWLAVAVAQQSVGRVRPGGTLLFMGGTGGRSRGPGMSLIAAATAAMPALIANLAVEVAPVRVNLIAPGFVDTPLSASLLGDDLEQRRAHLRDTLPIGRVVGPQDVAALAVHIMTNTALTGATYDIDGGQQLIQGQ
jgi:NAD(P)-dependent dehydrogenase (short-subunit alcohol dehydrogenase family)